MSIDRASPPPETKVYLAPMSGVTDKPMRGLVQRLGGRHVVSEMVVSRDLLNEKADVLRRMERPALDHGYIIQLVGREPQWMAQGAVMAQDMGADVVDINMGCPAREVTGGLSGSALMRDLDHAEKLIEATVSAVDVPVTLKMRLGWDKGSINADHLAKRAEQAGVEMITVHGRTRCQFYKGQADWQAIRKVTQAVDVPVSVNGDIVDESTARQALAQSGADHVMIGRGAYGRPWLIAQIDAALKGQSFRVPSAVEQLQIARAHYEDMLGFYGASHGGRIARKHLGWYLKSFLDQDFITDSSAKSWRQQMLREETPARVLTMMEQLEGQLFQDRREAA